MSEWYDPWGIASETYHAVTGTPTESQKRQQANEVNAQVKAYKDQTEITRQEMATKSAETANEKRRVEEKQIRSLRNNYRAQSFLGAQDSSQSGMTNKLGD